MAPLDVTSPTARGVDTPSGLLGRYEPLPGAYDEVVGTGGGVRAPWAEIGRALEDLGVDELARRQSEVERLLDGDGVTYNLVPDAPPDGRGLDGVGDWSDAARIESRWSLDPVPMLLAADEWKTIAAGVAQRATLLDLVLCDLYGERDLVRHGLIPPEVVFGHPGFRRECDDIRLPGPRQLFTVAADLARGPDGTCTVISDRAQAPSGAGYALENRVVMSRVFPSLFRSAGVQRLAPFFRTLRSALQEVAPPPVVDPRIVVLSPGPLSETAFEHGYLASHLGHPLVQGADLAVRDGRVWMRSLGRLDPVDVILRRVDADFCDPLELRPDSRLGVPGLVEACRRGTVSVVNTLGSGVLENPGLFPFLPAVAEHLLGEPLALASVDTWWCGEAKSRSHVLANLRDLVVKPIGSRGGLPPHWGRVVSGASLPEAELDELRRHIEARPHQWVGQEQVVLAGAPVLSGGALEARRAVLRVFAVATEDRYEVMPGGLTRVSATAAGTVVSNQARSPSKDTWVLASAPEDLTRFWLQSGPPVAAVEPASIPARAAENLFWLGRYAERAEDVARLIRVVADRRNEFQDAANPAGTECLGLLLAALTHVTATYPGFVGNGAVGRAEAPGEELLALVVDQDRPGTLAYAVRHMLDAARAVRDQLSNDTWLVVGRLDRGFRAIEDMLPDWQTEVQKTLSQVMQSMLALSGLTAENMERDPGWYFMDAGRRIERAAQLASLLRSTITTQHGTATDSLVLESVLTASESIITYRRRYRSHAQVETLLDLLIADTANPRSLAFQLARLSDDVTRLPSQGPDGVPGQAEKLVAELVAVVRAEGTDELAVVGPDGRRERLALMLERVVELLHELADVVDSDHFAHPWPQRTLTASTPADTFVGGWDEVMPAGLEP